LQTSAKIAVYNKEYLPI